MRFLRASLMGIGPLTLAVDFEAIPGKLVAITGPNGAGKSTFLEALAGCLYRDCPTRGSLADLAHGKNATTQLEVEWAGERWTLAHNFTTKGGQVARVLEVPETQGGGVSKFDEWVDSHFPSPAISYASWFAPQGGTGIVSMRAADRKDLVLQIVGCEHLEALAGQSRELARTARQEFAVADARLRDQQSSLTDEAVLLQAISDAESQVSTLTAYLTACQAAFDAIKVGEAENKARLELESAHRRASERIASLETENASTISAIGAAERLLALRGEVDAATKALADRKATLEKLSAIERLKADIAREEDKIVRLEKTRLETEGLRRSIAGQRTTLAADAAKLDSEIADAEKQRKCWDRHTQELRAKLTDGARMRAGALREALVDIAAGTPSPRDIADDAIAEDDVAQEEEKDLPGRIDSQSADLHATDLWLESARSKLRRLQSEASRLNPDESFARSLETTEASKLECHRRLATLKGDLGLMQKVEGSREELAKEIVRLEAIANRAGQIHQAQGRLEGHTQRLSQLGEELEAARAECNRTQTALAAAPKVLIQSRGDVERRLRAAQGELRAAEDGLAVSKQAIVRNREAAAKLESLKAAAKLQADELSDWDLLARSLGKNGLQAIEADAAAPELAALTNDLLHSTVGPRFTVAIETTRLRSKDKAEVEGFDFRVIDSEAGREGAIETLSGGERVLVGEAIALALSMLACNRNGIQRPTLVRDETGAALDEEKSEAYVAMLRRAAEFVGADKVLLVSHNAAVRAACDARIEMPSGIVS